MTSGGATAPYDRYGILAQCMLVMYDVVVFPGSCFTVLFRSVSFLLEDLNYMSLQYSYNILHWSIKVFVIETRVGIK